MQLRGHWLSTQPCSWMGEGPQRQPSHTPQTAPASTVCPVIWASSHQTSLEDVRSFLQTRLCLQQGGVQGQSCAFHGLRCARVRQGSVRCAACPAGASAGSGGGEGAPHLSCMS